MKFNDVIRLSLNNLMHRKLRSWLTILGIVIGVAAVISIVSIGSGMQNTISNQLSGLGANTITVSPGFARAVFSREMGSNGEIGSSSMGTSTQSTSNKNLTIKDIQAIKTVPGVEYVDGIVSGSADMLYMTKTVSVRIQGVDPLVWKDMTTSEIDTGRFLASGDQNVIVIGNRIATQMFKSPLLLNTQVNVGGKLFKVVGILKQSGIDDSSVYMPEDAARTIIDTVLPDQYSSIQIVVKDSDQVEEVTNTTDEKLMNLRHVNANTKDFTITSAASMQATISSIMNTMSIFLTGIAAISLFVGAIGIANTMFMSVMERTRQIGVLKALGTTNTEVTKLFLTESAIMGFIGGLLGIFLGFIVSGIISEVGVRLMGTAMRSGTTITLITPELVIFTMIFSIMIGALSGYLPARRAAKLEPVDALRYE